MSLAQQVTYEATDGQGTLSNDEVYAYMKQYDPSPEPRASAEQLINFITKGRVMTAVDGKRISQPVYRALSEGASAGFLDDSATITNPETGYPNTLYRLLKVKKAAKVKDEGYKAKSERLAQELKELKAKYEVCCNTVDKQEIQIQDLKKRILAYEGLTVQ